MIRTAAALFAALAISGPAGAETAVPLASIPGVADLTCADTLRNPWPDGYAGLQVAYVTGYLLGELDHGGSGDAETAYNAVQSYCARRPAARLLEVLEALRSARSEGELHSAVRRP